MPKIGAAELTRLETPTILDRAHRWGRNLNDIFVGTKQDDPVTYQTLLDINSIWTQAGIQLPAGPHNMRLFTRRTFHYPLFSVYTKMIPFANWAAAGSRGIGIVINSDTRGPAFACGFVCHPGAAANEYSIWAGSVHMDYEVEVTALMPANAETARHWYQLKLNRASLEFRIDNTLKGVMLFNAHGGLFVKSNVLPYAISGAAECQPASDLPVGFEMANATEALLWPIGLLENWFGATDGEELTPCFAELRLENTNTVLRDYAVASGVTVNSHPFPIWGTKRRTFHYLLTATLSAATLQVPLYSTWYDLATLTVDGAYHNYTFDISIPVFRLHATGGTGGGVINRADMFIE